MIQLCEFVQGRLDINYVGQGLGKGGPFGREGINDEQSKVKKPFKQEINPPQVIEKNPKPNEAKTENPVVDKNTGKRENTGLTDRDGDSMEEDSLTGNGSAGDVTKDGSGDDDDDTIATDDGPPPPAIKQTKQPDKKDDYNSMISNHVPMHQPILITNNHQNYKKVEPSRGVSFISPPRDENRKLNTKVEDDALEVPVDLRRVSVVLRREMKELRKLLQYRDFLGTDTSEGSEGVRQFHKRIQDIQIRIDVLEKCLDSGTGMMKANDALSYGLVSKNTTDGKSKFEIKKQPENPQQIEVETRHLPSENRPKTTGASVRIRKNPDPIESIEDAPILPGYRPKKKVENELKNKSIDVENKREERSKKGILSSPATREVRKNSIFNHGSVLPGDNADQLNNPVPHRPQRRPQSAMSKIDPTGFNKDSKIGKGEMLPVYEKKTENWIDHRLNDPRHGVGKRGSESSGSNLPGSDDLRRINNVNSSSRPSSQGQGYSRAPTARMNVGEWHDGEGFGKREEGYSRDKEEINVKTYGYQEIPEKMKKEKVSSRNAVFNVKRKQSTGYDIISGEPL